MVRSEATNLMTTKDTIPCFVSHLGLYAMEPMVMRDIVAQIKARKAPENLMHLEREPLAIHQAALPGQMQTVAVIPFAGPISKKPGKFNEASAIEIRAAVRAMAKDPTVSKIVLHIDSPGGAVGGIDDLAAEVREAAKLKPVVAYIEDLGASAAYWVASQATEIIANRGAFVGSLGVYGVIHDTSGAYEREGIKVHVVSSGGAKGKGVAGIPVDETTLAEERRLIEAITDLFKTNVKAGRGMTNQQVTDLFDGRVHMAGKALELGLIDRIGTFEDALAGKPEPAPEDEEEPEEDEKDKPPFHKEHKMNTEKTPVLAYDATNARWTADEAVVAIAADAFAAECADMAKELKAAGCPLTEESIARKLKASGSMAEATKVYAALSGMKASVGSMATAGSQPDLTKATVSADPKALEAQFSALVKKHREAGLDLMKAVFAAKEENPELHAAYVNANQRKSR